jgi:hypothetical protein
LQIHLKRSLGFTALELVLAVALTAVLVGGGFYVYTQRTAKTEAHTQDTPAPESKPVAMIDIPELGLSIPKSSSLEGLKFKALVTDESNTAPGGVAYKVTVVGFTTTSLEDKAKGTTLFGQPADCGVGALGSIAKYTADPEKLGVPYIQDVHKIGINYYALSYPDGSAACSEDEAVVRLSGEQRDALNQAFKQAQVLK